MGRLAVIPLRWDRHGVDVCAVIDEDDQVTFVARDVLEALGHDPHQSLTASPAHPWAEDDAAATIAEHADGARWSAEQVRRILADVRSEDAAAFLRWLGHELNEIDDWGADRLRRITLDGPGSATTTSEGAEGAQAAVKALPARYSVASVAKILSRDPAIQIGRDGLFEWLHKSGWIDRVGSHWKPVRDVVFIGYLTVAEQKIPTSKDLYPQVCITPLGIEALHQRFGGTAELHLEARDHLTLIEV